MQSGVFAKLQRLDARHPGLWRTVDAMLEGYSSVSAISAHIEKHYGERIGRTSIWNYKRKSWRPRQNQLLRMKAEQVAWEEFASEERR
jgi:hypothetical protein